jgi:hypothetical protein
MPDVAGSWPEEVQQPYQQQYPAQQQYQQPYPQQQGYPDPQYAQQQQYQQPQYPPQQQPPYQDQTVPQQAVAAEEEQSSVPSEFDHLFRDSSPQNRKSISGRQPVVSGPGAAAPGFQQQQQPGPAAAPGQAPAQATAVYAPQQPGPVFDERPIEYQQPFGNGGYADGGPGGGGDGSGGRRTPLIIGGVVAVIAVVGLYLGLSGGGGGGASAGPTAGASTTASATQASNETAQQQAADVYKLVQQSKQLRSDINAEVGALDSCTNVGSLQTQISGTAQQRQAQADQVSRLDVSKISNGASLVSALKAAWTDSATSDSDYAKAASDVSGSCSKSAVRNDSYYQAASQGSNQATRDKDHAVDLWNSTMPNYGQSRIDQSDL